VTAVGGLVAGLVFVQIAMAVTLTRISDPDDDPAARSQAGQAARRARLRFWR
jgi:hypothetical protein